MLHPPVLATLHLHHLQCLQQAFQDGFVELLKFFAHTPNDLLILLDLVSELAVLERNLLIRTHGGFLIALQSDYLLREGDIGVSESAVLLLEVFKLITPVIQFYFEI